MHTYTAEPRMLTHADWLVAKRDSQVTIRLDKALARSISSALAPDFRTDGSKGLALNANAGPVLKAGDRIEHIEGVQDVFEANLESLPNGTHVTFFQSEQGQSADLLVPLDIRRHWRG